MTRVVLRRLSEKRRSAWLARPCGICAWGNSKERQRSGLAGSEMVTVGSWAKPSSSRIEPWVGSWQPEGGGRLSLGPIHLRYGRGESAIRRRLPCSRSGTRRLSPSVPESEALWSAQASRRQEPLAVTESALRDRDRDHGGDRARLLKASMRSGQAPHPPLPVTKLLSPAEPEIQHRHRAGGLQRRYEWL